jgi:hypothetical protein
MHYDDSGALPHHLVTEGRRGLPVQARDHHETGAFAVHHRNLFPLLLTNVSI